MALVWLRSRHLRPKVRSFIDYVAVTMQNVDWQHACTGDR
jgi:hypothetical protein